MMRPLPKRRHLPHQEIADGTVFVTWRLAPSQSGLTPPERDVVLEIVQRCPPDFAVVQAAVIMDDHAHYHLHPRQPESPLAERDQLPMAGTLRLRPACPAVQPKGGLLV